MENLPFLTKNQPEPQLRSAPPAPENEWPTHMDSPRRFEPLYPPEKKNPFESFKENQIGLILLGIVIGVIIANMRPVIFQAK
jgi:hypothetical protein